MRLSCVTEHKSIDLLLVYATTCIGIAWRIVLEEVVHGLDTGASPA